MTDQQFDAWCIKNQISGATKKIIQRIRSTPSRTLKTGTKSIIIGKYPSRKMGHIVQFESHKVQQYIVTLEHDSSVLEYYTQPEQNIHTGWSSSFGKMMLAWIECKPEEAKNRKDEAELWGSPPAENYAQSSGFTLRFSVVTRLTGNLEQKK